jgi:hypothetical protein
MGNTTITVLYPSMFNLLPDFVTSKLPFYITKIRYAMYAYNVQVYSVLYNNAVRPVIFEGLYFTHMYDTESNNTLNLTTRHSFLKNEVCK